MYEKRYKNILEMNNELKKLIADFGGGREKQTEKSQLFYDLASDVLWKLNDKPYSTVGEFSKYLKEIAKKISVVNIMGREITR